MARVSVTANKLDAKRNSLLIQAHVADGSDLLVGVMTSETVFKTWSAAKLRWSDDSCKVPLVVLHYAAAGQGDRKIYSSRS